MTERSLAAEAASASIAPADQVGSAAAASTPPELAVPPTPPALPPAPIVPPALPEVIPAYHAATNGSPANGVPSTSGSSDPQPPKPPALPTSESKEDDASPSEPTAWSEVWTQAPSWLGSMVMHLALVIMLALLTTVHHFRSASQDVVVSADRGGDGGDEVEDLPSDAMQMSQELQAGQSLPPPQVSELPQAGALNTEIGAIASELQLPDLNLHPRLGAGGGGGGSDDAVGAGAGNGQGNSLELRLNGAHRLAQVRGQGGTPESEYAVRLALHWLAEHQNYDGSWTFEHQKSPKCHGACGDPGFTPGKVAATALALLPFLGTGQTQREGEYKKNIDLGLRYLVRSMEIQGDLGSLNEPGGQMYGHGLAAIVLCEAYGMTRDQFLQVPAQAAINFIVEAQDPSGGGWRYQPRMPGDTSVVGWQVMALKSAQMAYLRVPPVTFRKAGYFLDHVQGERGSVYGYQGPERMRPATTAIGLLCRMYMGWQHDFLPLERGVQILGQLGPSTDTTAMRNNMYYNYYATQVMHHWGGYPWQRWNTVMREYLIRSQDKHGHQTGSWFFNGADHGSPAGGRLYCTALSAMTLEVYYRHMPLYRDDSTKGSFSRQ